MIPQDAAAQINLGLFSSSTQMPQQDPTINTVGLNYNDTYDPITKKGVWISHPDYLLDYLDWQNQPHYRAYDIGNTSNYVSFWSNHNSIVLYRDSCTAKIYNGGKINSNSSAITTVSFDLQQAQNATDNWYDSAVNNQTCVINYVEAPNQVTFDMAQSIPNQVTKDIRFIFNLETIPEAILSVTNNNQNDTQTKYGFAVTLNNIPAVVLGNQTFTDQNTTQTIEYTSQNLNDSITVNGSTNEIHFDTQNSINHYLWAAKVEPNNSTLNLVLDYKNAHNALPPNQTLQIDPTWTSPSQSTNYGVLVYPGSGGGGCVIDSSATHTSDEQIVTPDTGDGSFGCQEFVPRWNISGFPVNIVVNSVTYQFDVSYSGHPKNCDFTEYTTTDPATQTAQQIGNAISGATRYVTNTSVCTSVSSGNQLSLGSTAVTDMQTKVGAGTSWFAVGDTFNDFNKDQANENEVDLINNYLIVAYTWNPPVPITTLGCNDNAINSVNCSWTAPTSTDSIVGYYLTQNTTLNAPLYTPNLIRYYKLDYKDPQYNVVDSVSGYNATLSGGSFGQATGKIGYAWNATGSQYLTASSTGLPIGSVDRTIAFWFKTPASFTNGNYFFEIGNHGTNHQDFGLTTVVSGGGKVLYLQGWNDDLQGVTLLQPNTWYNVACIVSSAGTVMTMYLNGALEATSSGHSLNTASSSLYIGAATNAGANIDAKYLIDDFRIYNSALTASQIAKIYNYQLITGTIYTDTTAIYPKTYNYNVYGLSDKGQVQQVLGNTVQIAPYNVIDPPFKANATLGLDSQGFYENLLWTKPKVANSICGSLCAVNGYQVQSYNTTLHGWQTLVTNQSTTTYKDRNLMQNTTQQIRLLTSNHAGWSAWTFPLNQTTYPQEVSHWLLQNNLIDTRNLNNGTLQAGNWNFTSGRNGNAQYFDGLTYDKMSSNNIPIGANDRTITSWIKIPSCPSSFQSVVSSGNVGVGHEFDILLNANTCQIYFGGYADDVVGNTAIPLNTWAFVSIVSSNSGNTISIYLNGILDKTATLGTTLNTSSNPVYFGYDVSDSNYFYNGLTSDVRIFNSALTSQQQLNLYNSQFASRQNYAGTLTITNAVVGNVMGINGTLTNTAGFPQNANLTNYKLVNGSNSNAVLQSNSANSNVPLSIAIPEMYNITSIANAYNYLENVTMQTSQGNIAVTSNTLSIKGLFNPAYYHVNNATTPNWSFIAKRTHNANNVILQINGNPITFSTTCTMQSSYAPNDTITIPYNNVGFVNGNYTNFPSRNTVYGYCTDPGVEVVNFTLYGNQTGNAGFMVFGDVLGETSFFGVSWIFLIVLLTAATVTAKDSVIGIIITVAMIGILAEQGMINSIPSLIWSGVIMLAAFGVFIGKKALFD